MLDTFKVALVQMSMSDQPRENVDKALSFIREAARQQADIVCLPELFRSPYFCQREDEAFFDLAEPVPGPTTEVISKIARELKVVVIASLFERRAPGLYHNTAVTLDNDGQLISTYRKMHIPDDPSYYEKYYFTPGDLGFKAYDSQVARIGTLVCWDQWYPEAARLTALQGASILFYPTAIGWHPAEKHQVGLSQKDAWVTIQRSHAIASGVYVAAANRVGHEKPDPRSPGLEFWGNSFLSDPFGVIIAQGSADKEELVMGEVSLQLQEKTRRSWPFLRDRRIDAYAGLEKRFIQ